jgi:hypothetical protein
MKSLVCALQKKNACMVSCSNYIVFLSRLVPDAADELVAILFRYFCLLAMLGGIA